MPTRTNLYYLILGAAIAVILALKLIPNLETKPDIKFSVVKHEYEKKRIKKKTNVQIFPDGRQIFSQEESTEEEKKSDVAQELNSKTTIPRNLVLPIFKLDSITGMQVLHYFNYGLYGGILYNSGVYGTAGIGFN
jgi:hypothetical protein